MTMSNQPGRGFQSETSPGTAGSDIDPALDAMRSSDASVGHVGRHRRDDGAPSHGSTPQAAASQASPGEPRSPGMVTRLRSLHQGAKTTQRSKQGNQPDS